MLEGAGDGIGGHTFPCGLGAAPIRSGSGLTLYGSVCPPPPATFPSSGPQCPFLTPLLHSKSGVSCPPLGRCQCLAYIRSTWGPQSGLGRRGRAQF